MSPLLPVNVEALLRGRRAESARLEFKARWRPETTGFQVLRTICAFANDHLHLNGSYVAVGVAEEDGRAVFPPAGLSESIPCTSRWCRPKSWTGETCSAYDAAELGGRCFRRSWGVPARLAQAA